MKLSFITALYNCLPLTQAMLASLRATLPAGLDHEILLVDDGSTDGTRPWLATLAPDPRIRVLLNDHNLGFAASNNRAARAATGDILVLLNNDLVLLPGWLPPMLAALARDPRAGLVGNIQLRAADRQLDHCGLGFDLLGAPRKLSPLPAPAALRPFRCVPAVTAACCLARRHTFLDHGAFDEAYRNGYEDLDLCRRLSAAGLRHTVATRSRVLHHVSASPGRRDCDAANYHRFLLRWGRPAAGHRLRALVYLRRYAFRPWRYHGAKLLLSLAWLATGRPHPALARRLALDPTHLPHGLPFPPPRSGL